MHLQAGSLWCCGACYLSGVQEARAGRLQLEQPETAPIGHARVSEQVWSADDGASSRSVASSSVVARTYDYATEEHCDRTKDIFLHSIQTAADTPGQGFAAIKVNSRHSSHERPSSSFQVAFKGRPGVLPKATHRLHTWQKPLSSCVPRVG